MPKRSSATDMADAMKLNKEDRRRYLAAQRKRLQRQRDQSHFVEVTVKVPRERADELRALARSWCDVVGK